MVMVMFYDGPLLLRKREKREKGEKREEREEKIKNNTTCIENREAGEGWTETPSKRIRSGACDTWSTTADDGRQRIKMGRDG